ncbi:amino acid adenylation domain-containing protein/thioester reductase-like protein [Peribacillus simplex]|uniref:non-ribosomal peptide synthetase n=1 Tax=Peribacillus simplex TaxID=1478 RepID=UPI0024E212D5|nr:amino acid adenylation domain-containing protein [Peribacillus simplex]MDF9763364.1 amino acid adenylation domain-containing protein/thioester reductase-like protein [Peribacillus simplex]
MISKSMTTNKLMSITEAFKKMAGDNQSKAALYDYERQITYKELDILSDNLAKRIIDMGIQEETMIGIPSKRSIELIVGMLAIIKSGCCYVPIDEKYPLKRLEYMLEDTDMEFFLSFNDHEGKLSELDIEPIPFEIKELSREGHTPVNRSSENGLAYVIYTSGTTGKPKGVMIEQRSVVNLVLNSEILEINENNRVAQFSNPCFDAATFEIWGALLNGATLFLMTNEFTSFDDWKEAISIGKVDVAFFTTGLFNAMVDEDPLIFEGLKKIVVGGDKISISHVKRLKQTIGHFSLINGYGPTECTTFAICHEVEDKDVDVIPIGKPLTNVEIRILSEEQVEVGDGEIGEIHIGGQGVMRGYLNQPQLTEQALIMDDLNQTKWYKTGDHGIRLNNGEILYKGRKDSQVKIRGFRIELNEIQDKLDKYMKVESSVVAVKNINDENYVIAYYKQKDENAKNAEKDIKDYLGNELPNYMIPHFFVRVDDFPLNANGKVDKAKLLEMDIMQNKTFLANQEYGKKKEVLEIWRNILGNQSLGLDDNFFENGGHSILATKLVYIMKETVLPEATLQILLENNTVNKFVGALEIDSSGSMEAVMEKDSTLDRSLMEKIRKICTKPVQFEKNMMITGGTGFLGAHLLNKLLRELEHVKIYCLVRFPSRNRLKDTLMKYGLWQDEFESRIVVIEGDFSKHQFGLDDMTYEKLSNDVSHVYHVGAETNFFEPYSKSKVSNVDGVVEIIKFASSYTRKNIYYASTLSVLTGERKWDEEDELVYSPDLMIGYSQSKWVAEKLLLQAREYGLTIDIFRLGRISSNSLNGVWNEKDMLYKVFESFIEQRILPFKEEIHFELMPVDFVSEFMYKISRLNENQKLGIYHMFNDQRVSSEFVTSFFEKNNIPYSNMDLQEWLQSLKEKTQSNEIHSLSALSQLIEESTKLKESEILQSKTKKDMEWLSMKMPEIDSRYVESFMKFMLK